jgi:hypothetical protein
VRKRYLLGAVVGVLSVAFAALALAAPPTDETVKYAYTKANGKKQKKPKKPAGFNAFLQAENPGTTAPTLIRIRAKGAKVDFEGSELCTLPKAQAANCPESTKLGGGKVKTDGYLGANRVAQGVSSNVTAYLKQGGLYLVVPVSVTTAVYSVNGTLVIDASLSDKAQLVADIKRDVIDDPLFATPFGRVKPVLTEIDLKLGLKTRTGSDGKRHTVLRTPKKCPKSKRWKVITKWNYEDGFERTKTKKLKCKRPAG